MPDGGDSVGTCCARAVIKERTITVTNMDAFIWRLIEDCVQLGPVLYVNININMTTAPALTVNGLRSSLT
jgi:hypothetical protein